MKLILNRRFQLTAINSTPMKQLNKFKALSFAVIIRLIIKE